MNNIPILINWSLTNLCNLDCKFCFMLEDKEIDFREKDYILNNIINSGVTRVTLTGGEPTLINEFEYIVNKLSYHGIFSSVHTNGTLLKKIKKNYKKINRISLSLDGPDKKINALMRGKEDYFEIILNLIKFLKDNNRKFTIKTLASKKNIEYIPQMASLIDKLSPEFWSISQFRPIRVGKTNKDDYEISNIKFSSLINSLNCQTKINTLSLNDASTYPIFLISANGNVYTNDLIKGDIYIGSALNEGIDVLWKKILSKNNIQKKHLEKYDIITSP